jgi:hypothetical protein
MKSHSINPVSVCLRLFLLTSLPFWGIGCTTLENQRYETTPVEAYDLNASAGKYNPVAPEDVIVYVSEKFAPKNYVLLAKLHSTGEGDWLTRNDLMAQFKQKAAALGANAVIVLDLNPEAPTQPRVYSEGATINDMDVNRPPVDGNETTLDIPIINSNSKNDKFKGDALAVWATPPTQ